VTKSPAVAAVASQQRWTKGNLRLGQRPFVAIAAEEGGGVQPPVAEKPIIPGVGKGKTSTGLVRTSDEREI
jgi:hypothetical protein